MSILLCESRTYISGVHSFSFVLQNIVVSDLVHQGQMRRKSFSRKIMFTSSVKNTGITYTAGHSSGVPRNFVRGGGSTIQLRTEDRENGHLGAVAP